MKNLITLLAIVVALLPRALSASADYQQLLLSHDYQLAKTKLERLHKSDNDGLQGLIRFVGEHPRLRTFAIHRLVALRCNRYLQRPEASACGKAVLKMLEILDFDIRFIDQQNKTIPAFVFVAFETSLIDLLNQESTGAYLSLIANKLEAQSYNPVLLFNLWTETLAFHHGDELRALSRLATLFQDTSTAQIHLEYLARRDVDGSRFFDPNVARLARVLELLIRLQQERPELYSELAYPPGMANRFNNSIYHFYVPWFLTKKLQSAGVANAMAGTAPFMLTATYEFITFAPDYKYLFRDPAAITSAWTQKDLFAGLSAARTGVGLPTTGRSIESTLQLFEVSTAQAMREVLRDFTSAR